MGSKEIKTNFSIMTDMLIVLLVMSAMSVYYYGVRAAAVIGVAVGTCITADFI